MKNVKRVLKDYVMYVVLIVLMIIFSLRSQNFFSPQNLLNILNQNAYLIVAGVGITFIMLAGAMDLSIGYQMSVNAVLLGIMVREGIENSVVLLITGIAVGVLLSTINGLIYARLKIFPFIITLAMQYILYGVSYILSEAKTFKGFDYTFKFIGSHKFEIDFGSTTILLPMGIIVMVITVLIGSFILNKTFFGRNIYALGSNPEAVSLSGVSVAKMRIAIFALAGFFFGLSTIMAIGRTGSATSGTGAGSAIEFVVMAGAMLGGIKMGGGGGKMNNMVVGMLIIGVLNNGMDLANLSNYWQKIAMGVILLIAITIDTLQSESVIKRAKMVMIELPEKTEEKQSEETPTST
jgi:ribose transport system permease protein